MIACRCMTVMCDNGACSRLVVWPQFDNLCRSSFCYLTKGAKSHNRLWITLIHVWVWVWVPFPTLRSCGLPPTATIPVRRLINIKRPSRLEPADFCNRDVCQTRVQRSTNCATESYRDRQTSLSRCRRCKKKTDFRQGESQMTTEIHPVKGNPEAVWLLPSVVSLKIEFDNLNFKVINFGYFHHKSSCDYTVLSQQLIKYVPTFQLLF